MDRFLNAEIWGAVQGYYSTTPRLCGQKNKAGRLTYCSTAGKPSRLVCLFRGVNIGPVPGFFPIRWGQTPGRSKDLTCPQKNAPDTLRFGDRSNVTVGTTEQPLIIYLSSLPMDLPLTSVGTGRRDFLFFYLRQTLPWDGCKFSPFLIACSHSPRSADI